MKFISLLLLGLIAALIYIPQTPLKAETAEQDPYKLHKQSSERLVTIMQRLVSLTQDSQTEEIAFSQDDLTDMVETVEELLFYAELMSIKVPATQLEENESVIFSAMASKLYDEILNIQQLLNTYDLQANDPEHNYLMNSAFDRLNRTCAACHQLFRDD